NRRRSQHRMTADQLKILNRAFFADLSLQHNLSLNAGLTRQGRIIRLYLLDQKSRRYTLRNANALWCRNFWNRACGVNNAPHDATQRTSGHSTRNAAHHAARHRRRRFLFLNNLDFLWNLGRRAQLAVDDVALNFDDLYDCRWRWWRRRRRW